MDPNKEMLELLKRIDENSRRQARYAMLQCLFTFLTAVCFGGMLWLLYQYLPQIADMVAQMQTVLGDLEQVTKELAAVDFAAMVRGINTLVGSGQSALEQTVAKLNTLDLDTLNKAIQDLSDVVEPVARFFNTFR